MRSGGPDELEDRLDDMSADELLSYVEVEHAARQRAGRNILRAAYQWAVRHHPDRLPPTDRRGRERARLAGGAGTPMITEHAAAAFGARIQTSPYGARRLIADACDLAVRLPRHWAGIEAGTVRDAHARHVAEATRDLSVEEARWVDAEVVEVADGRLGRARFEAVVQGKVAAASPELARAREEAAAKERYARMSRVNANGMGTFTVRADAATILGIETAVAGVADQLRETMPDAGANDRRIAAVALLANPSAHADPGVGPVKPMVKIYLHITPDSPVARMEGHGPVTTDWINRTLCRTGKVRVTPVIDLDKQAPVDAYEIPAAMREAVHLIHPADVFPFAASTSRKVDLDHAVPWSHGGPTAVGNLGPLTRTHHRIKTHAGWEARHPFPGIVLWRDPHGAHYLVDSTGTRRVTGTDGDRSPTPLELHFAQQLVDYIAA